MSNDTDGYNPFGMQVVMTAQPGKGKELAKVMLQASNLVAQMPGNQVYIVQLSLADGDKVLITEVWDSKEAHQASLGNAKVLALISQAKPLIAGMEHHAARPLGDKLTTSR